MISIGNITVGGTGKTPLTIDLAQHLIRAGKKVAIISRGYRRLSQEELLVVSDGQGHLVSCLDAGDEPYLMALSVPDTVVIVGKKRAVAAQVAIDVYDCNVILLDDGLQHRCLERDLDLVLIDYSDDPDKDFFLPAGRLREPMSALRRADWIVLTKLPMDPDPVKLDRWYKVMHSNAPGAHISSCRLTPSCLKSPEGVSQPLDMLNGRKVIAVSGIARPRLFEQMLSDCGANVLRSRAFPDHHWYRQSDLEQLSSDMAELGAEFLVTTEKDIHRLIPQMVQNMSILALALGVEWLGEHPLVAWSHDLTKRSNQARPTCHLDRCGQ